MGRYNQFTVEKGRKTVDLYFTAKSPTLVYRQFQHEYPRKKILHCHTITRLVESFWGTESMVDNNKGHNDSQRGRRLGLKK